MARRLCKSFFLLLTSLLGACTYSTSLDDGFYKTKVRYADASEKLPLAVGIVRDANTDDLTFSASGGGHNVNVELGQPLLQAVEQEFATLFETATVVETPNRSADFDVYAFLDANWNLIDRNNFSGSQTYHVQFTAVFKDKNLKRVVGKYSSKRNVHYTPPASAVAASAATGASLFLLAPLTVPFTTYAVGAEAEELLKRTITTSVRQLRDQVASDGRLRDYANGAVAGDSFKTGPRYAESVAVNTSRKYEHLLDAVVVVESVNGFGSGFVVFEGDYVITNAHVVAGSRVVRVRFRSDDVEVGTIVDVHPASDLALIDVAGVDRPTLDVSVGTDAVVGNEVLAIGTPKGLSWSISKGIVSAVRDLENVRLIQTDAAVNTGNSVWAADRP